MALISEWMQQCGKKVLDNAGIVRDACSGMRIPAAYTTLPTERHRIHRSGRTRFSPSA